MPKRTMSAGVGFLRNIGPICCCTTRTTRTEVSRATGDPEAPINGARDSKRCKSKSRSMSAELPIGQRACARDGAWTRHPIRRSAWLRVDGGELRPPPANRPGRRRRPTERPPTSFGSARLPAVADAPTRHYPPSIEDTTGLTFWTPRPTGLRSDGSASHAAPGEASDELSFRPATVARSLTYSVGDRTQTRLDHLLGVMRNAAIPPGVRT